MKRICITLLLIVATTPLLFSQGIDTLSLSLRECVRIAVKENITIRTANWEVERSRRQKAEAISALIPRVNAGANYQDNLRLQTVPLALEMGDVSMIGTVQMGMKYNLSTAVTLNWTLYNQTAITAAQLAQKMIDLNRLGAEKASETLATSVAELYFLALITAQQKRLINENISRTVRIQEITALLVANGMSRQVDLDRININIENLYTQQHNTEAAQAQQLNMLKYTLNLPLNTPLTLTDSVEMPLSATAENNLNPEHHIDVRLLESQHEINHINRRVVRSGYLPSLAFTGQYAIQGQRNEFRNFFNSTAPESVWYNSSYIGLGLSIPIFDGLERRARSQQVGIDLLQTEAHITDTKEKLRVDYQNARTNYENSRVNLERQQKNIALAERVYDETSLKYREGQASITALLQDEMSMLSAQSNYLNALYTCREAEIQMMSINGQIRKLIAQ
ncbi:MAG: TolC family protein [Bacteroidales bacterium]|jgi:outer membrane protein TolC|nr:TolC family protein [Bacteroidales bacterium]